MSPLIAVMTLMAASLGGTAQRFPVADLDFRVIDAVTSNGVAGVTIRRAAAFRGKCPPVRMTTDENGAAHYRGQLPQNAELDIVSAFIHPVRRLRVLQGALGESERKEQVIVRRKVNPHPMKVETIPLQGGYGASSAFRCEVCGLRVETGHFESRGSCCHQSLSYAVLTPTGPEDGLALVKLFPDELGLPIEAPLEGYRSASAYLLADVTMGIVRNGRLPYFSFDPESRESGFDGNCIVFRRKTSKGFVYGAVVLSARGIDVLFNDKPGERSLEPEVEE